MHWILVHIVISIGCGCEMKYKTVGETALGGRDDVSCLLLVRALDWRRGSIEDQGEDKSENSG